MDHVEPRDPIADGYRAASGRTAGFTYRPYPAAIQWCPGRMDRS